MYNYRPVNLWLKEEPIVWLIVQPITCLTEMLNIFIEQPSCLGFFKGILFFWKSSDKTSLHIDLFMLLYSFVCCSIYLLLYRFSYKMSKIFSKVVSILPAEANVKSRRKTDEKILENNRAKTFHFYFPTTGKHHSIGLKDRCWPEDLSFADRLKFAASGESNKKMPLRFSEGTFEAKFIGVTETEDAGTRVLTQVENKIDAPSSSQI